LLTPHLHVLVPEAVWDEGGRPVELPRPDKAAVEAVLRRTVRQLARRWPSEEVPWEEDDYHATFFLFFLTEGAPLGYRLHTRESIRRAAVRSNMATQTVKRCSLRPASSAELDSRADMWDVLGASKQVPNLQYNRNTEMPFGFSRNVLRGLLLAALGSSLGSFAAPAPLTWLRDVHITYIGCEELTGGSDYPANYQYTCFVGTDAAAAVGPSGCQSKEFRFNTSYANGKNTLSLLTAAYLSGKPVGIEVSNTCNDAFPGFPTFLTAVLGW
jgi:hypothetical protein